MGLLWLTFGVAIYALTLGGVGYFRSPRHPAHISFAIGMALLALNAALGPIAPRDVTGQVSLAWQETRLAIVGLIPAPWIVFSRCYSRGDATVALRRLWPSIAALSIAPLSLVLFFREHLLKLVLTERIPGDLHLGWAGVAIQLELILVSVVVLTNLERTFRGSVGVMRWRIKYMVIGVAILFGFRLYTASQAVLYRVPFDTIGRAEVAALLVGCILITIGLTRGSAFDLDVYPSQTLIYGSLTVLLAGTYLVIVGVLSHVVTLFGGTTDFPLKAFLILVALAGLAVGLLSERVRQYLRRFVSRHLRRPVYDYRRVWSTFTARTTSLVDEVAFCRAVASWMSETFQALSASLWLIEDSGDRLRLGGSTVLADEAAVDLKIPPDQLREALGTIGRLHGPTVLDASRESSAATLQRLHPEIFRDGGRPVCQPLNAGGKLLGMLILGDRVRGLPFTTEDFDLLKCVGDQVAANLLGLQLSAQLLRAKEIEAFQSMSAFFVHDLKNTASTLSLTLQNLNQHFSDPAFREDALRAVGKSVQHLNSLIARLSRLRQELHVQPVPRDLKTVVDAALATVGQAPTVRIDTELSPLPPVLIDAEQLEKVVVNLLVNAREAIGTGGEIRIRSSQHEQWGILAVSDNGCGMSPEFLQRSLFKPFQTTKKNGLGIGMFHSKTIVEAHRGRLEVESTPGKGTTVRVLLPLANTL